MKREIIEVFYSAPSALAVISNSLSLICLSFCELRMISGLVFLSRPLSFHCQAFSNAQIMQKVKNIQKIFDNFFFVKIRIFFVENCHWQRFARLECACDIGLKYWDGQLKNLNRHSCCQIKMLALCVCM